MINRRLLRIKLLQTYYAHTKRGEDSLRNSEKELLHSIEKSVDLYFSVLLLGLDIADLAAERIEIARQKRMPTAEDLEPNTRFIDLWYFRELRDEDSFVKGTSGKGISWVNNPELIKTLYGNLLGSELYKGFMGAEKPELRDERKFLVSFFSEIIAPSEELCQVLEDQSIYWNDDSAFILSSLVKDVKASSPGNIKLPRAGKIFKEPEDESFVKQLLRKVVIKGKENRALIEKHARNWDVERIALMDVLIMELAITEVLSLPSVPVKVSLNEYIEISKTYSSKKSSTFINGILDKVISELRAEGKIKKTGKGLIGE